MMVKNVLSMRTCLQPHPARLLQSIVDGFTQCHYGQYPVDGGREVSLYLDHVLVLALLGVVIQGRVERGHGAGPEVGEAVPVGQVEGLQHPLLDHVTLPVLRQVPEPEYPPEDVLTGRVVVFFVVFV